jgi:hypothetical protein
MSFFQIALLPIGGKREKKTFETLKNLSNTVVKSVKKFREGVSAYSELNFEKGEKILGEVDDLESEADKYGYQFESELGGGAFLPAFRGDLSKLAESIDDIADTAEESIREIYRRPRTFEDLAEAEKKDEEVKRIRSGLVELAEKSVGSAEALDRAVSVLMENMDEAAEIAEEVHRREHESDEKENEIAIYLFKKEKLLNPVTVMQIRGLINRFGAISDAAESSGDTLSAMTNALKV